MYFGRTKHGGKWQWIMGTTAALIARLILLQPLVMFTSLHVRGSQFSYNNPSSLPLVFFVTKHFLSCLLVPCLLKLTLAFQINKIIQNTVDKVAETWTSDPQDKKAAAARQIKLWVLLVNQRNKVWKYHFHTHQIIMIS